MVKAEKRALRRACCKAATPLKSAQVLSMYVFRPARQDKDSILYSCECDSVNEVVLSAGGAEGELAVRGR